MTSNNLNKIEGVWTALVTPFLQDLSIDWHSFDRLCDLQAEAQVQGIVLSGTTGESPTLENDEKIAMITRARSRLPKTVRIMAGSGNSSTKQSIELSLRAVEAGADSLLVVTPPYNKPNFSGLKMHYESIASATKAPVCLYHVPGRTNQRLSAEQIAEITNIPGVSSVKEASADMILFSKSVLCCGRETSILSGDDFTYLPSIFIGAKGVISVISNIFPKAFVMMTKLALSGQKEKALQIHEALFDFTEWLFCETNPTPAKAALASLGFCENKLRLPLAPVSSENYQKICESLKKAETQLKNLNC